MDKLIYAIILIIGSGAGTWLRLDTLDILLAYIVVDGIAVHIVSI